MGEKGLLKTSAVTIAKMIKLKKNHPIFMPAKIVENLMFTDREETPKARHIKNPES